MRAYRKLLGAQVRSQTAYRTSFVIDVGSNILIPFLDVSTIIVMFRVARDLGGFPAAQVLVMYGLSATAFAIADLAVGNIERIRTYVRLGTLDAVLLRPLGVLGQLLTTDFTLRRGSRILIAAGILGLALHRAGVVWTPARVVLLIITPLAGALFFASIFVATATVAFWWIDSGEMANSFTYGGRDFTFYPVTVFDGLFRRLFAYSLGFAFVGYYPALALLGRADPLGLPAGVAWAGGPVTLTAATVAALLWRSGIRHYRSTGS